MPITLHNLNHLTPVTVYCIGRNYADHALELNNPIPDNPVIFTKPVTSLLGHHGTVLIPDGSSEVHHEGELVLAIGKGGKNITHDDAFAHIAGIAAGIDITDRKKQSELKKEGLPWLLAKGLDTFAPVGNFFTDLHEIDFTDIQVELSVNETLRQSGNTKQMLFPVADLIVRLSAFFTLQPGDLIFTGTPAGVGPLQAGDEVTARIVAKNRLLSEITVITASKS